MELSNVLYYSLYEHSIYIYTIRQECGKYFIGKTNRATITIDDILQNAKETQNKWVIQYKPAQIIELIHSLDTWDENKITLKYMDKYGIENVRGGSFSSSVLSTSELATIRAMIANAKGICTICDIQGHTKTNCPIISEFNDYEVVIKDKNDIIISTLEQSNKNNYESSISACENTSISDYVANTFISATNVANNILTSWFGYTKQKPKCLRCGISSHKTESCMNEIKNGEDSLIFPDNKIYNPIYKTRT